MTAPESLTHTRPMNNTWIREHLERLGLKVNDLAAYLELTHDKVSKALNGKRNWKASEERRILKFFQDRGIPTAHALEDGTELPTDLGDIAVPLPRRDNLDKDVPVYGVASAGDEGAFLLNGEVIDMVRRPHALAGVREGFAIYVQGDSMAPRWEPGELVYIHPRREPTPGCDVVVEFHGKDGAAGPAYLKRLIRRTATEIVCKQFNPAKEVRYTLARIKRVYRVISPTELFGL